MIRRFLKHRVKPVIEKLTNTHIYRYLPKGLDGFNDLQNYLPNLRLEVIFDVGANRGQSAKKYLQHVNNAKIFCFEPVESTFRELERNLKGHDNIQIFRQALSSEKRTGKMIIGNDPYLNSLADASNVAVTNDAALLQEVQVETLEGFCSSRNIDHINFLKIDTEGEDLEVLKGSENMLRQQKIDVIEVEAGMNGKNKKHVPYQIFSKFFEEKNYFLFGIYEQESEQPTKQPNLRRANLIFISDKVIQTNIG